MVGVVAVVAVAVTVVAVPRLGWRKEEVKKVKREKRAIEREKSSSFLTSTTATVTAAAR